MTSQRESLRHSPDGQLRKGQSYSYSEIWAPLDQTQAEVPGTFSQVGGEDLLSATEENNARLQNYRAWKEALARSLPDEPEEEFWSPEPVVAWRAWRWTGSALRGVRVEWSSSELVAVCDRMRRSPRMESHLWHLWACNARAPSQTGSTPQCRCMDVSN